MIVVGDMRESSRRRVPCMTGCAGTFVGHARAVDDRFGHCSSHLISCARRWGTKTDLLPPAVSTNASRRRGSIPRICPATSQRRRGRWMMVIPGSERGEVWEGHVAVYVHFQLPTFPRYLKDCGRHRRKASGLKGCEDSIDTSVAAAAAVVDCDVAPCPSCNTRRQ